MVSSIFFSETHADFSLLAIINLVDKIKDAPRRLKPLRTTI
jgi:hypothetical protein